MTLTGSDDDTPPADGDDEQNPLASTIYLWPEGNMAKVTNYTGSQGSYQDPPSFRPYMNYFPAADGMTIKGAVPDSRCDAYPDLPRAGVCESGSE